MFIWIGIVIIIICVVFEAFFSGSEIALISVDKIKLRHMAEAGSHGARQAQDMLHQPERFLGTTLVGTNISVVLGSVLMTRVLSQIPWFAERNIELYVVLILTPIGLILGEIVPKSIFQQYANAIVPVIAPLLHLALKIFYPLVFLVSHLTNKFLRIMGVERKHGQQTLTREELKFLIHTDAHGSLGDQQRKEMMQRVFEFGDTTVREVMVPLVEVVALEKGTAISAAIEKVQQCGFSRIPIYEERIDRIIGIIHAFDLFRATPQDMTIDRFIRKAYYIPEIMQLDDLLQELQRHRTQIAVVVDEYGGSLGIVTLEDSLEEIVGEIEDEFDDLSEEMYKKLPNGAYRIYARMEIDDINEALPLNLPEGTYETLGGFLLSQFYHIPTVGEVIEYRGWSFKVEEANARAIIRVLVSKTSKARKA
jgi:CBS domain containing-hemolysin-like protein